jgi:hypothetical protein
MAWLRRCRLRWVIAGAVVAALVVAAILAWPHAQRYTGAAPPAQFYQKVQLEPTLDRDYKHVLGVAHNAGNNLGTLAKALRYGADVIEFDVISARGRLVAGRNQPLPRLARQVFRGPTLAEGWDRAAAADVVKLDLKQADRGFLDDLVGFVAPRAKSRRVMIGSVDPGRPALPAPSPARGHHAVQRGLTRCRPPAAVGPRATEGDWRRIGFPGPGRREPGHLAAPAQAAGRGVDGQRQPTFQRTGPAGRRRHHHSEPGYPPGSRVTQASTAG